MNSLIISWFGLTLILSTVLGQTTVAVNQIVDGPCSRFAVVNQEPFIKKLLTGNWYVYASYDYADILGLDCLVAHYQLTPDGNMRNRERGKNLSTNERKSFQNTYNFNQTGVGFYQFQEESLHIPVAEYNLYYIEFSCVDMADGKADCYIAAYTRAPFPGAIVVNRINEYLDAHSIDRTKLRFINHEKTSCFL